MKRFVNWFDPKTKRVTDARIRWQPPQRGGTNHQSSTSLSKCTVSDAIVAEPAVQSSAQRDITQQALPSNQASSHSPLPDSTSSSSDRVLADSGADLATVSDAVVVEAEPDTDVSVVAEAAGVSVAQTVAATNEVVAQRETDIKDADRIASTSSLSSSHRQKVSLQH